jgi:hypothetical protein
MPRTTCSFFGCHKIFRLKFFARKGFSLLVGTWFILGRCKYVGYRFLFPKHIKLIRSGKRPSVSVYQMLFISGVENNGCKSLAAIFMALSCCRLFSVVKSLVCRKIKLRSFRG